MTKAIIIASGQSLYDENVIEKIKDKPDLTILSTDRTLKHCLDNEIIPKYVCVQENLKNEHEDLIKDYFFHGIVKNYADKITLYYSQLLEPKRLQIINDIGFKTIPFRRYGCGNGKGEQIQTCGHCGMALIQIARHILKIDHIATIGLDIDYSTSWVSYENTNAVKSMLSLTKRNIANDYFNTGQTTFNLTKMGNFHGKGIKETTVKEFLDE